MRKRIPVAAGFTLAEVVLALGLAAVFMVGIISVLGTGLTSSGDAADDARVSLILRDVHTRMRGVPLVNSATPIPPQYYDVDGVWLDQEDAAAALRNIYRVSVKIADIANPPVDGGGNPVTNMKAVVVEVHWPVELVANGDALPVGAKPKLKFSYYVTPMTGNGWTKLDPTYIPRIEG